MISLNIRRNHHNILSNDCLLLYGLGNINGEMNLEIKGVSLLSKSKNIIDFQVNDTHCIWINDKLKIYSIESKQSWWYGWNRNRTFTSEWKTYVESRKNLLQLWILYVLLHKVDKF